VKDPATEITGHTTEQNRLLSALEAPFYYCVVLLGGGDNNMNKQALGLSPPFTPKPQTQAQMNAVAERKVQREVKNTLDGMVAQLEKKAREVKREVKKREAREVKKARKVQREVKNTLDGMVAQLEEKAREVKREQQREAREVKKMVLREAVAARKEQREVKKRLMEMVAQVAGAAAAAAAQQRHEWLQLSVQQWQQQREVESTLKERQLRDEAKKRAMEEYEGEWEACWGGSTLSKRCRLPPAPPPNSSSSSSSAAPPGMGLR
jgi:hypothetical protein